MQLRSHRFLAIVFTATLLWGVGLTSAALAGWAPLIRSYEQYAEGEPAGSIRRGGGPSGVAVVDFNNDGLPDVVAANPTDSTLGGGGSGTTISILLHTADPHYSQMFQTWTNISAGALAPLGIAVADMNLDGKPDIVTCNVVSISAPGSGNESISVLRSSAFGLRAPKVTPVRLANGFFGVGDLNGDGLPDIAASTRSDSLAVLLAVNADSLGPPVKYDVGASPGEPGHIVVADATGDGIQDVLIVEGSTAKLLPGNNTGAFSVITPLGGPPATAIAVASLNGDAFPDIVTATSGNVSIYFGTGGGSFQSPFMIDTQAQVVNIRCGDIDGDGDTDLVTVGRDSQYIGNVMVIRNLGGGIFGPPTYYAGLTYCGNFPQLADVNMDGRLDLVGSDRIQGGGNTVNVLLNDGAGGFLSQVRGMDDASAKLGAIADFNRDGKPDLAASDTTGLRISLGNGDGTFVPGAIRPMSSGTIATADVNRDGKVDLLAEDGTQVDVFLGVGDGTVALSQAVPGKLFARSMGDLNRDGRPDIVGTDASGNALVVYLQQANQLFSAGTPVTPAVGLTSLCLGDWSRDGIPDVAVVGPSGLSTFPGSSITPGTLNAENVVLSGKAYIDVCTGDFNRDGIPDLAARLSAASGGLNTGVDVFLGTGAGTFSAPLSFGVLEPLGVSIDTWDVNRDGILDLITGSALTFQGGIIWPTTSADVLLGTGSGSFGLPTSYGLGKLYPRGSHFVSGDVDGNGVPDIIAGTMGDIGQASSIGRHVIRTALAMPPALGSGYQPSSFYSTSVLANQVVVGDLNRDGKLDAMLATLGGVSGLEVHLGTTNGALGAGTPLPQSSPAFRVALADLNRDGILDVVTSRWTGTRRVSSMLGIGNGTFGPRTDYFVNADVDFEIGDMNRDGIPDVVTSTPDSIRVLLGNGNGTFTAGSGLAIPQVLDLDLADLDRDGVLDVVCTRGNKVSVLFSHGDGTLGTPIDLIVPVTSCSTLCVADFNRDGFPDIVVPDSGTFYIVWGSPGSGYFSYGLTNLGFDATDVKVGEAQADGEPFLYVTHDPNQISVLRWNPLGSWDSVGSYTVSNSPVSVALGDMNRDGVIDFLTTGQTDTNVSVTLHGPSLITAVPVAAPAVPHASLRQNYPNPFNPVTTIRFTLTHTERARLDIFDTQGRLVAELENRVLSEGEHTVRWTGVDRYGHGVASGVYFYSLVTESGYRESRRMVEVR